MRHYKYCLLIFAFIFAGAVVSAAAQGNGFNATFSALDTARWYVSNGWTNGPHQSCEWRADAFSIQDNKLLLTLSDRGGKVLPIGCPEMHTKDRLGYGLYETRMRTAAGSGLNTAFFTYVGKSDGAPEHDEIDFEFLGKSPEKVEVNYFAQDKVVKGKIVDLGFDSSKDFHDYAFDWEKTGITWFVDGKEVYKTPAGAPVPRNPQFLFFSLWSGSSVEDSWMGPFSYTQPATAEVGWAKFTPHE